MVRYKSFDEMWDDREDGDDSLVSGLVEQDKCPDYEDITGPTLDPIVNRVITRMTDRSKEGMVKFKKTMAECDKPTVDWIDDTIEELLDAACYLERLKKDWYYD